MLAAIINFFPFAVTDGSFFSFFHSSFCLAKASPFLVYSSIWASVGLMIASPSKPSAISISPSLTSLVIVSVPTTAGISNERAMIAEWAVLPPTSVTNPLTYFLLSWAVSLGVKS